MTDPLPHPVVGRHGLLRRLMLLILAAILAPMVLLGVFGWASLGDVRDGVLAQRLATARAAAAYFDHGIRESLKALASIPWTADPSARLEAMRAARQRSRLIRCVSIIDASGTVVAPERRSQLIFYVLTILGLFVLRRKQPDAERPYRAFGYPVAPALYILAATAILLVLLFYRTRTSWPGLAIVLAGVPVYFLWRGRRPSKVEK